MANIMEYLQIHPSELWLNLVVIYYLEFHLSLDFSES